MPSKASVSSPSLSSNGFAPKEMLWLFGDFWVFSWRLASTGIWEKGFPTISGHERCRLKKKKKQLMMLEKGTKYSTVHIQHSKIFTAAS